MAENYDAPEQAPALIGKMNPFKLPMLGPTLQSVVFGNWVVNCCTLPPLLENVQADRGGGSCRWV